MKNIVKKITAFALAFSIMGGMSTAVKSAVPSFDTAITASAAAYSTSYSYCTASSDLQIRQGAGTSYGFVKVKGQKAYVKPGVNFKVTKVSGSWGYSTSIPTNRGTNVSGWVCLNYCNFFKLNTLKIRKVNTTSGSLNKRTGPSTSYSTTGSLAKGSTVIVYSECNGFSAIDISLETWVSTQYLK